MTSLDKPLKKTVGHALMTGTALLFLAGSLRCSYAQQTKNADIKQVEKQMSQSVEDTLTGCDVVYVNDRNYKDEVFDSGRPVITLFYVDSKRLRGVNYSRGLAVLAKHLYDKYSKDIKFVAYLVTAAERATHRDFNHVVSKYGLKDVPALLFYDNDKGKIELEGAINGGYNDSDKIFEKCKEYETAVSKEILD